MEYRKVKLNKDTKHQYTIDTDGIVTNVTNGKVLKGTSISKNNRYIKIHLDKFYALHRLVASHLLTNDNPSIKTQVNHIDGNRNNNSASNLEWCTPSDNVRHAYKTGLKTNNGKLNPISRLTETQVRQIWALKDTNLTARQIRDKLNLPVGIGAVKLVRSGKNWGHITDSI